MASNKVNTALDRDIAAEELNYINLHRRLGELNRAVADYLDAFPEHTALPAEINTHVNRLSERQSAIRSTTRQIKETHKRLTTFRGQRASGKEAA